MCTLTPPPLGRDFRDFFKLIDSILPKKERSGDDPSVLIYELVGQIDESSPNVGRSVRGFLEACTQFRKQQWSSDAPDAYRDTSGTWLPLIILGGNWWEAVEEIFSFELPKALNRTRFFRLIPVGRSEKGFISVILSTEIRDLDERLYDIFVKLVKDRFKLRAKYDAQSKTVTILDKRPLRVFGTAEHMQHFFYGRLPKFLEFLLELQPSPVVSVEIAYHLRDIEFPALCDATKVTVVYPKCPIEWRGSEPIGPRQIMEELDDVSKTEGYEMCHFLLTAPDPEWHYLLDAVIQTVIANNAEFLRVNPEKPSDHWAHVGEYLIERYLSLPHGLELRVDSDFEFLRRVFETETDADSGAEGILTPRDRFRTPLGTVERTLIHKLGRVQYLAKAVEQLATVGQFTLGELRSVGLPGTAEESEGCTGWRRILGLWPGSGSPEITQGQHDPIAHLCAAVTETILGNLTTVAGMFQAWQIRLEEAQKRQWGWMNGPANSSMRMEACSNLLRLAVCSADRDIRLKALSGLFYVVFPPDVIHDLEGEEGALDDQLALAMTLRDISQHAKIDGQLEEWAKRILARVDERIDLLYQQEIAKMLSSIRRTIGEEG